MKKGLVLLFTSYSIILIYIFFLTFPFSDDLFSLVDYRIYYLGLEHFTNNESLYSIGFAYLPSFFYLFFFIQIELVYVIFSFICLILCGLMMKDLEDHYLIIIYFELFGFLMILVGNIDVFLFLLFLLSYKYRDNEYIPPILLAFGCFKPTFFIVILYFFLNTKKRLNFLILFILSLGVMNLYFLLHPNEMFNLINWVFKNPLATLIGIFRIWLCYYLYIILNEITTT